MVDFIKAHPELYATVSNMCRFGMESTLADRKSKAPVAKPTRWLTSSQCVAKKLHRRCLGGHRHAVLISGRASAAQVYPPPPCARPSCRERRTSGRRRRRRMGGMAQRQRV